MKKRILTVLLAVCLVFALGTVSALADDTVAKIGDTPYTDLSTAFNAVKDGETIVLQKDVELTSRLEIRKDKTDVVSFTLDLNNRKLSRNGTVLDIYNSDITIENGTIETTYTSGGTMAIFCNSNVDLTIADDAVVNALGGTNDNLNFGIGIGSSDNDKTISVTVDGTLSGGCGLTINGNIKGTENDISVNINGTIDVTGLAVYLAGYGKTTINSTASVKGDTGIEIRAGELTVNGGTIVGGDNYTSAANGNGSTVSGAGIAVSQHTTNQNIDVRINRGNISGAVALAQEALQSGNNADQVKIDVAGGSFKATAAQSEAIKATNVDTVTITGGKFQKSDGSMSNIDEYLAPGLDIDEDGDVVVGSDAVAQVGDTVYTNLQDAIDAAQNGSDKTVEILKDFDVDLTNGTHKNGIYTITGNITIDGNNRTIKATGTPNGDVHVFVVSGSADAKIIDLNINGNGIAHYGIQAYGSSAKLELDDVEAYACEAYGVFSNNGATVTAANLRTHGNEWGGVNVDYGSTFTMKSGHLADRFSVVVDGGTTTKDNVVNLTGGTYNNIQIKTEKSDVNISGGTYNDIVGGNATDADRYILNGTEADVTGGTFEENVNRFARVDYVVVGSDYSYFGTLNKALAAAGVGDSIDYLGNSSFYTVEFVYEKGVSDTYEVPRNNYIELPGGKYDGKVITGWTRGSVTYDVGDDVKVDRNMTFYVVLKDGEFDIVIDSKIEHGDISTNVNSADKGDTVYIYVDPDTGYVLDDIDVYYGYNYRNSVKVSYVRNNTYRFEMPNADVYITATFKANGMPFVDVHRTQWFYDSIYYVWSNDMMEGDSATTFNPDGTMTRAMFWAVLGRMDGQTITGTNWVEQARNWAMREGVSDGTNPNDYVTREQMVTMLWRYAGEKNGSANLNRYTDSGSVSGYAVEAMRWAIGNGVIQGVTSTTLAPKANATRAECATIFMRFDKM